MLFGIFSKISRKNIAFFTLIMSLICGSSLSYYDKYEFKDFNFPALLMEKIGIDKKYRCFKIGKYICLFCLGLAQKTNENLACTFFIFKQQKALPKKFMVQNIISSGKDQITNWYGFTEKLYKY